MFGDDTEDRILAEALDAASFCEPGMHLRRLEFTLARGAILNQYGSEALNSWSSLTLDTSAAFFESRLRIFKGLSSISYRGQFDCFGINRREKGNRIDHRTIAENG
jgi:hypothetical protein